MYDLEERIVHKVMIYVINFIVSIFRYLLLNSHASKSVTLKVISVSNKVDIDKYHFMLITFNEDSKQANLRFLTSILSLK